MLSHLRCPNTRCIRYGRRLEFNAGQDEDRARGLMVEHKCLECRYVEFGPSNPTQARRVSPLVSQIAAENLRRARESGFASGVVVPLVLDDSPFPEEVDAH